MDEAAGLGRAAPCLGLAPQDFAALKLEQSCSSAAHGLLPLAFPLIPFTLLLDGALLENLRLSFDPRQGTIETILQTPPHTVGGQRSV